MSYTRFLNVTTTLSNELSPCPECGGNRINTATADHRFPYGEGESSVELTTRIPVHKCLDCQAEFFDSVAEDLMHDEVCRHLGVMTPAEIRKIRERCGSLTRSEFALLTRLGEATLGRWERGELIQNAANDQLLFLLTFPENVIRLRQRLLNSTKDTSTSKGTDTRHKFRILRPTPDLDERAKCFKLATTGAA